MLWIFSNRRHSMLDSFTLLQESMNRFSRLTMIIPMTMVMIFIDNIIPSLNTTTCLIGGSSSLFASWRYS
jgi:hypothetical protein